MHFLTTATLALLPAAALAAPRSILKRQSSTNCTTTGVHMIVARASTEAAGEGATGQLASAIAEYLPGSDSVAVDYPATLTDYANSETSGVSAMTSLIQEYVGSCPDSKIVLLGYSQGAHVIGDVLCGASEVGLNASAPLGSAYSGNIAAVIQFGDPSHVANLTYDRGTSTHDGIFPRQDTAACLPYASRLLSYCDSNDEYCDSGDSIAPHLLYLQNYGQAALEFVVETVSA